MFRFQRGLQALQRGRHRDFGECSHRGADFREIREPGEVARQNSQHHALSQSSERFSQRGFVGRVLPSKKIAHRLCVPLRPDCRIQLVV